MLEDTGIQQRLSTIAERIDPIDPNASSRLRDLRDSLDPGQHSAWVYADVFKIIDPETIADEATKQTGADRLVGILEWIRNGFVLLPLILTWLGISDAVSHYHAYLTQYPDEMKVPFLQLWENGFAKPGSNDSGLWLTLSRLALIDFLLLFALFILTLVVHGQANILAMRRMREEQELKQEISHALADASLALARKREQQKDPQTLMDQFQVTANQLISQIAAEREDLNRLGERREDEVNSLSLFTPSLERSTQEMVAAAETMRAAQQEHAQIVSESLQAMRDGQIMLTTATRETQQTIASALMQSQQAMSQELNQAQQAFVGAARTSTEQAVAAVQRVQQELLINMRQLHQELISDLRDSQTNLVGQVELSQQTVLRELAHGQESLHSSIQALSAPMQSFAEQQGQLLASNQEATRQLSVLTGEQRQWSEQLQEAMQSISQAVEVLQSNTGRSLEIAQQIAIIGSGLVEAQQQLEVSHERFLAELAGERAEQIELARTISESNSGLEGAVSQVRQTSQLLHSISIDLYDLARSWPGSSADGKAIVR
ncbi:MAG: hypothetical protein M3441_01405 [Chloroflexota bacterium]|nr:hypothetical protein [Chloroflexota bacterium]MDQ5852670.1 hypothetical protein [Chloroflexota bacterium]